MLKSLKKLGRNINCKYTSGLLFSNPIPNSFSVKVRKYLKDLKISENVSPLHIYKIPLKINLEFERKT